MKNDFITASIAKEFRRTFYMSRRSPVIQPGYVFDKTRYWEMVHAFFLKHDLRESFDNYKFMCGFDMFKGTEIISSHTMLCTEGMYEIQSNDVCWMTTSLFTADVRTHNFFHLLSNQAKLEGYVPSIKNSHVLIGDKEYSSVKQSSFLSLKEIFNFIKCDEISWSGFLTDKLTPVFK